jgi:hypothetical protein
MSVAVITESPIVLRSPEEFLPHQCSICRKRIAVYSIAVLRQALRNRQRGGLRPAFVPKQGGFKKFESGTLTGFFDDLRSRIAPGEDEQVWS